MNTPTIEALTARILELEQREKQIAAILTEMAHFIGLQIKSPIYTKEN